MDSNQHLSGQSEGDAFLAVQGLHVTPHYVLTNAPCPFLGSPCLAIFSQRGCGRPVFHDLSILAKVERDRWMKEQANRYPRYGFDQHMGYGTKAHWEAIRRYGLTPLAGRSLWRRGE